MRSLASKIRLTPQFPLSWSSIKILFYWIANKLGPSLVLFLIIESGTTLLFLLLGINGQFVNILIFSAILAIVIEVIYTFVKENLRKTITLHFFPKSIKSKTITDQFGREITTRQNLNDLKRFIVSRFKEILLAQSVFFIKQPRIKSALDSLTKYQHVLTIAEAQRQNAKLSKTTKTYILNQKMIGFLEKNNLIAVVGLFAESGVQSYLGIGGKKNNILSDLDLEILDIISIQAGIALEKAQVLNQSENEKNLLSTIMTEIPDGVIALDYHRKIIFINKAARRILKTKNNLIVGKLLSSVFDLSKGKKKLELEAYCPTQPDKNTDAVNFSAVNVVFNSCFAKGQIKISQLVSQSTKSGARQQSPLTHILTFQAQSDKSSNNNAK